MAHRSARPASDLDRGRVAAPPEAPAPEAAVRSESFATSGPLAIELRVPAGRVELRAGDTGDSPETTVEIEALRDNESSVAAVEATRIELRERAAGGQEVLVHVPNDSRGFAVAGIRIGLVRSPELLVRVSCPWGASIDLETGSADIEGHGKFGTVKVAAASGDVEFEEIAGEASVSTASGDIELGRVDGRTRVNTASGDVDIDHVGGDCEVNLASGDVVVDEVRGTLSVNSASGDVVVREAASSVTIKTASGDQRLDSVSQCEVNLQSASGDIQVRVRPGVRLWLDARSRSGDTSSDLDVGDVPPEEGAPTLELRANSMSGDIHVGRAA
jgi:DUF4097 and DUF4098 domain-containing protein YvlB